MFEFGFLCPKSVIEIEKKEQLGEKNGLGAKRLRARPGLDTEQVISLNGVVYFIYFIYFVFSLLHLSDCLC